MTGNIKISILDFDRNDEDDIVKFKIVVSNEAASNSLEFYDYIDAFKKFAEGLISFPQSILDAIELEIGSNEIRSAYHLLIKVFCYEANGDSAIHIVIDNHEKAPETSKSEFYVKAKPAAINNLGLLLLNWDPVTEKEVSWSAS